MTEYKLFINGQYQPSASGKMADDLNPATFVFTQYYPVLRGGKATGEEGTGGKQSMLSRPLSMGN